MTLIPFDKTTSRYSDNKNWSKVLFNKDKKLQTTEFIEIQDLIENQVKKLNKNLYNFYNIVRGCKVLLINIDYKENNEREYQYLITAGQAFIELKEVSAYVDIPSLNFTINNNINTYYIGVQFKVELLKDADTTRDVFSGGEAFGYLGADRLIVTPSIGLYTNLTEEGGFYPIAIIRPKTKAYLDTNLNEREGEPDVFYYRNNELDNQYSDNTLPIKVKEKLNKALYEISGDFISEGLDLSYVISNGSLNSTLSLHLKVDPGVAYINGKRITYNYIYTKEYPYIKGETKELYYYCYINIEGKIKIEEITLDNISTFSLPEGALELGSILINDVGRPKLITGRYLMPEVSDLIKLKQQHNKNKRDILNLSLRVDELLSIDKSSNLTGILSDSFSSLKNSNTSHPLYNASIAPSIQAITLPFISVSKDKNTFTIENEQDLTVKRINNELYWASTFFNTTKLPRNKARTTSINVGVDKVEYANLEVSPNIIFIEDDNIKVSPIQSYISDKVGSNTTNTEIISRRKVKTVSLLIKATGFSSNEDNVSLKIDTLNINSVDLLEGTTSGSTTGSYRANEAGHIVIKTDVEINTEASVIYVFLESNSTSASNQIQLKSLSEKRSLVTSNSFTKCIPRSSSIKNGIASVFNIENSFTIKGVEIILTQFNNSVSANRSILDVYLTKTNFGIPTDEVLAKGSLKLLSGVPVLNTYTEVEFDKYTTLTPGEYGLVFTTTYENLELAASVAGNNITNLGVAGSYEVVQDVLYNYNKNVWEERQEVLTLNLVKAVPNTVTNTTSIFVEDIEEFNAIEINLPIELSNNSTANLTIDNKILNNGVLFFDNPVTSAVVDINTLGTQTLHPIIELDNLNINLFSYSTNGTWVSLNKEFVRPYNFVEVSFDIFNPPNSSFDVYFSSNQGQTWELLSGKDIESNYIYLEEFSEVNRQLPLFRYKFRIEDLSFAVLNNETIERTQLMVRIDLSVTSLENIPFFKNLIALTY